MEVPGDAIAPSREKPFGGGGLLLHILQCVASLANSRVKANL